MDAGSRHQAALDDVRCATGASHVPEPRDDRRVRRSRLVFVAAVLSARADRLFLRARGAVTGLSRRVSARRAPISTSAAHSPRPAAAPSGTFTLYTSVTQTTVDAVVAGPTTPTQAFPLDVFRAPTGELAGPHRRRPRAGRIRGDVLWLTDPLSIAGLRAPGPAPGLDAADAAAIDPGYRRTRSWAPAS